MNGLDLSSSALGKAQQDVPVGLCSKAPRGSVHTDYGFVCSLGFFGVSMELSFSVIIVNIAIAEEICPRMEQHCAVSYRKSHLCGVLGMGNGKVICSLAIGYKVIM